MERIRAIDEGRLAWILLGVAMCISATWLMIAGKDLTFSGDEIFYYGRLVTDNGVVTAGNGGLEYFLAPHNGHLVLLGKLIYRGLFLTVGADYAVFRAVEVAGVLTCSGLFFVLARRRVGPWAALIPSVLLLFLGYAGESLVWPFNLHTILALALGLGALLALERNDRRGDLATCVLLVLCVATVELGLAFAAGVALSVLLRADRRRRAWIFAVPLALFAIWWLWAQQFGQATFEPANVRLIPIDITNSLAAVVGSIFGVNPTGAGVPTSVTTVTPWGVAIAALAVVGLVFRLSKGKVAEGLWISLAVILTYWAMIAMAGRPPDSVRYIFVGAVMVLLTAAAALWGARPTRTVLIVAACIAALAIPPNIAKFNDERTSSVADANNSRTEYAMLELARPHMHGDYFAAEDQRVSAAGAAVFVPLSSGTYFNAVDEFGSFAFSLDQIRDADLDLRDIADATLVGALDLKLDPTQPPQDPAACPSSLDGRPGHSVFFYLQKGGVRLGSLSQRPVYVWVGRFGLGGDGVPLGRIKPGEWADLRIPTDTAPDRWWVTVDGPVYVCPPPSGG
jgi:hypothetical protein